MNAAAMLRNWVAPLGLEKFQRGIWRRSAWAQPQSANKAVDVLTWDVLGEVLAAKDPAPEVTVCKRGELLPFPAPRDLEELRAYMTMGVGLAMRHTQRCHPKLASLALDFALSVPGEVQVQLIVTPARTHGFDWRYDAEDTFIAQTAGSKDYFFRENTVAKNDPFPPPDFQRYHEETSAIQTATLVAGDFLYIPARWWHMAVCREDSLSISVGVAGPSASY